MKYCQGCGVLLQSEFPDQKGYIPSQSAEICKRCFRIKHYNEVSSITIGQEDFTHLFNQLGTSETNFSVLHIVDIFDFHGSILPSLPRLLSVKEITLVVNKMDLLPQSVKWDRIRKWALRQAQELQIPVTKVICCSARKKKELNELYQYFSEAKKGHKIFVVGATNVGKSTLINAMLSEESIITTSRYPGTTLDLIEIPLENGAMIVDTPGILQTHRYTDHIDPNSLATIIPDRTLRPLVYQLNAEQTLFFGGMARFDFLEGNRQSFTLHLSNQLLVHRTKLERADELYEKHAGELLSPPSVPYAKWTKHDFYITSNEPVDIFMSGLGWIKVNSREGAKVRVHAPQGIKVILRKAMI